ncbi:MAG: glycosyltransferase [Bacteroidetes bacterium]|nr:glycosyltransferase [Bacteroidota bacterium]
MQVKILQVGKYYSLKGGVETITRSFVAATGDNFKVDALCFSEDNDTHQKQVGHSTIWEAATNFKFLSSPISISFFKLFKQLRNNYDIILIHTPNPMAALALLFFKTKAKVVIQWHGDILNKGIFYTLFKPIENKMLQRTDMILATSEIYLEHSAPLKNYKAKSKILPLGINKANLVNDAVVYNSIKEKFRNKKIVFSLGRYVYYKGFEYLIDAAAFLNDEIIILIGGHGGNEEKYMEKIINAHLQHKVFLVPETGETTWGSYYAACDVFCLPSYEKAESFGIVIIEAMAFSKPIIATDIPGSGTTWVNQNGITGLNVDIKNSRQLAQAIESVISDKQYNDFCINALIRFEENFTEEKMVNRFIELMNELLKM